MRRDDDSLDSTLDRYMGQAGEPPAWQVASSVEEVWERLRPEAEGAPLPPREMVRSRSHFTVAAAGVIVTVAIGLYAAQRTGLLQATLPGPQQEKPQAAAASPSLVVPANPVPERVTTETVAESTQTVTTSDLQQRVHVTVNKATLPPGSATGPGSKPSQDTTTRTAPLSFEVVSTRQVAPPYPNDGGPWTTASGRADGRTVIDAAGALITGPGGALSPEAIAETMAKIGVPVAPSAGTVPATTAGGGFGSTLAALATNPITWTVAVLR